VTKLEAFMNGIAKVFSFPAFNTRARTAGDLEEEFDQRAAAFECKLEEDNELEYNFALNMWVPK